MKNTPSEILNKVAEWLNPIAPTKIGFYQYPRAKQETSITIQPSEVLTSKRQGVIQALIIISIDSTASGAALELVELTKKVQELFAKSQQINSNLDKLAHEVLELENAKIIAPDPNQPMAQSVLNFKFTFT